jgi:flagellar protein FlaG
MNRKRCALLPVLFSGGRPMNTISSSINGHNLAMDGHGFFTKVSANISTGSDKTDTQLITPSGSEVAQNIVQNIAEVKQDALQLQKLSDMVMGRILQFNVNQELGSIVIKIVDPSTNKVIKEIPSEEMQDLKIRIRKSIGLLFDEMI